MTPSHLSAIAARHAGATPGPWRLELEEGEKHSDITAVRSTLFEPIAIIPHDDMTDAGWREIKANARFIAHSWQDVKDLLALVAEMQNKLPARTDGLAGCSAEAPAVANVGRPLPDDLDDLRTPPPAGDVEAVAKIVYEAMRWAFYNKGRDRMEAPEWMESGNSRAQDRAREGAEAIAAITKAAVLAERAACARLVADRYPTRPEIAAAIGARRG